MTIEQLNARFGIANLLEFKKGIGDFPFLHIQNQSASAVISLYGGHILSFKPHDEPADMLFLSNKAIYEKGKSIHGGIPVCWPWFGPDPKGLGRPNHGFVRNQLWTVLNTTTNETETKVSLQFSQDHNEVKTWKQPFTLGLECTIASTLTLKLITFNTGDKPFSVTQAFHSYFNISDIQHVEVGGLAGRYYYDKLDQGREKRQTGEVRITEEIDRIYQDIDHHLIVRDSGYNRQIRIISENCRTGVVWNPWQNAMFDLEKEDYRHFICVETGNIAFDLLQVLPGQTVSLLTNYQILH